jgi:hypothetical protein
VAAVLTLRFEAPESRQVHHLGPAPYFRLQGKSLRAGPDDREVGIYDNGTWHLGGEAFIVFTTESSARVRFEGRGQATHGPFERVKLVDGAIRCEDRLLARYDRLTCLWYSYSDQQEYPAAVLAPA